MSKYFDQEDNLRDSDMELARRAFERNGAKMPNYSLSRMYCGPQGTLSRTPKSDYVWMGYIDPDVQGEWCRFLDGWIACRKEIENSLK